MKKQVLKTLVMLMAIFAFCCIPVAAEEATEETSDPQDGIKIEVVDDAAAAAETEAATEEDTAIASTGEENWPTVFSDVKEGIWYYDAVTFVAKNKIAKGTSDTLFSPDATLTRAMLVTMMYRYAGSPTVTGSLSFSDIDTNGYYYNALVWATQNNIITGYPNGTFLPDANILRQDVALILCRFAAFQGKTINGWLDVYEFSDGNLVMDYAKKAMQWAYSYNIMSGKSTTDLDPRGNATRAECAKMIYFYDGVDLSKVSTAAPSLFNGNHIVTYDAMCEYLTTFHNMYPDLIRVGDTGNSEEGRSVKLVKLGTGSRYIYMQGNLHAREYISLNYLLEVLDSYAYAYATNASFDGYNVRSLLSQFTIVMIPCANPDGQNIAINGYGAAANPAAVAAMYNPTGSYTKWKANAKGVDLNRNFPNLWSASGKPGYAEYSGTGGGSAVETRNIVNALGLYHYEAALDCHTAGNLIYYGDKDCSTAYLAKAGGLAYALSNASGYTRTANSTNDSSFANYVRHQLNIPGLTIELYPTASYPVNCGIFTSAVWSKAKDFPLITMNYLLNN